MKVFNTLFLILTLLPNALLLAMENNDITRHNIHLLGDGDHQLGIRNAGTYENAHREKEEGFSGDAVCVGITIDNIKSLCPTYKDFEINLPFELPRGFSKLDLVLSSMYKGNLKEFINGTFDDQKKQELYNNWIKGINQYLSTYYVSANSSFVIVDYFKCINPIRDVSEYHGLGKFGRDYEGKKVIVAVIPPPSYLQDKVNYIDYFRNAMILEIVKYLRTIHS